MEWPSEEFKFRKFAPSNAAPSTVRTAEEERSAKTGTISSDYLIDVIPSLGVGKRGAPLTAVGTNEYGPSPFH